MAISNNSTGLRPGVCTSSTRPTAPYEGQHIYETDTDIEYVWNGSAWVVNYVSAASPAFTGTPTAPTATAGTNTTQLATTAFANQAGGLVLITSVTISSGSSTVDISSCFNATYDNYVVSFSNVVTGANGSITLATKIGSTITSSGWYGTEFYCAVGATAWSAQISANNAASIYCSATVNGTTSIGSILDIQSPYLAQYTRIQYQVSDSSYFRNGYGYHGSNTSQDGLRIGVTSGTFTSGTISVYGYRK